MDDYKEVVLSGQVFKVRYKKEQEQLEVHEETDDEKAEKELLEIDTKNRHVLNDVINDIQDDLIRELKYNAKSALLSAIGFSDSWGKWQVDHCNGRMGEIAKYIKRNVEDVLSDLSVTVPTITQEDADELGKAMKKEYMMHYSRQYKDTLVALAKQQASEDTHALLKEVLEQEKEVRDAILSKLLCEK